MPQPKSGSKSTQGGRPPKYERREILNTLFYMTKSGSTWLMQFVRRTPDMVGFQVLPKRWVVERTFAWLGKYRRLSKDYEYLPKSGEAFVYLASIHLLTRRLSRF